MQRKPKGQGLVEYAILLGLVTAAFIGMRLYINRGLQARYKDGADYAIKKIRNAAGDTSLPLQYEPYYKESYTRQVHAGEEYTEGADLSTLKPYVRQGGFNTTSEGKEVITRYEYEKTGARLNDQ